MKLLITTQIVDANDSDLGFFVRWIEEFAKNAEKVTVLCLHEGTHSLPTNVHVIPLQASGRVGRALELISTSIQTRKDYDAVFVHMNPEYIVVAGMLWRLLRKRVSLWYTHKNVDTKLRIATFLSHVIFTASKESFRIKSSKVQILGHGIDTDFFTPDPHVVRESHFISVGRLMKSKRHDLAIRAAATEGRVLRIAGEGPERDSLEQLAHELGVRVEFLGGLTQRMLRDEYRRAACLIHTSETGSLDKVVLEALACELPIRTNDPALQSLESKGRAYVCMHHSLDHLIPTILDILYSP